MIQRSITYMGQPATLACDARCDKAWGVKGRPQTRLSDDEDDFESHADDELGLAPVDPGTYEGAHAKPTAETDRLNKWCARECERSGLFRLGEAIVLPNFTVRDRNIPERT